MEEIFDKLIAFNNGHLFAKNKEEALLFRLGYERVQMVRNKQYRTGYDENNRFYYYYDEQGTYVCKDTTTQDTYYYHPENNTWARVTLFPDHVAMFSELNNAIRSTCDLATAMYRRFIPYTSFGVGPLPCSDEPEYEQEPEQIELEKSINKNIPKLVRTLIFIAKRLNDIAIENSESAKERIIKQHIAKSKNAQNDFYLGTEDDEGESEYMFSMFLDAENMALRYNIIDKEFCDLEKELTHESLKKDGVFDV